MSVRHLHDLLEPASVAVIGASDRAGSVGATVWRNLRAGGFAGPIWPVNPRRDTLDGLPCFATPAELPQAPALAVICTPPDTLTGLIDQLGQRGTRTAIVMTDGLGATLKQAVLDAARPHTLRILGPNCLGLLNPHLGLNASFSHADALPGEIAFISQSGALVTAVLDWARSRRLGFSCMVSLGEHADVDFGDLLDHLASDARTRAILLYIESIESPRKFMSAARAATRNKPVIVVKAGRGARGAQAAASHTGALAGSDLVFDAAIRRAGMLRVDTLQELFMAAETLARFSGRTDTGLTLLTNGGGAGVMAADAAERLGVPLAELDDAVRSQLDQVLPAHWSHANPVDIIGDAPVERYTAALRPLLADPAGGALLFMHAPTAIVRSDDIARACLPVLRPQARRVLSCWLGDGSVAEARRLFAAAGIADFDTPEAAVQAFDMLARYRRNQALLLEAPTASESAPPDGATARRLVQGALDQGRTLLNEVEAKALLQAYGIPVVATRAVPAEPGQAARAAKDIGFPVALKILSPDISHKSDVGGVALGLADEAAVRDAAVRMLEQVAQARPQARLTGFSVQALAQRPHARELIAGTSVDSVFGPVLLFGQGGTAVEVVADRAIALPPLNRVLAREMISHTRVARLMAGWRDHAPVKMDAVCDVLTALSQMQADLPELAELDINPLWADADGVLALDARVTLARPARGGADRFALAPYPAHLAETVHWQGQPLLLRPIRPEDGAQHRSFLDQVSAEDLRLRFFSTRRELPRSELARLTQIDYDREMAFVAVRQRADGSEETLGVARAAQDPDNGEAEFAVIVRSDLKGLGLGGLLMRKLIGYQAARGTGRLVGWVLRENHAMRALADELGFEVRGGVELGDSLQVVLPLQAAG